MNSIIRKEDDDLRVDRLVGFKIKGYFLFLSFFGQDGAYKQYQAIRRDSTVQLQPLLSTRDSCQDRETIDPGLDVGRSAVLLGQHGGGPGNLILYSDS